MTKELSFTKLLSEEDYLKKIAQNWGFYLMCVLPVMAMLVILAYFFSATIYREIKRNSIIAWSTGIKIRHTIAYLPMINILDVEKGDKTRKNDDLRVMYTIG